MSESTPPKTGGRRLTLLPEVLPAPTMAHESKVRDRTLEHLRGLLALAAATTTLTVACSQEPAPATKTSHSAIARHGCSALQRATRTVAGRFTAFSFTALLLIG